jgi:peptidoglycan/xylan/chitin deacetylase (PgdA/CDA1 family)
MLTPEAQQRWPDAEAYGSFLSRKFESRKLAYQIERAESGGDASSATVAASLSIQDSGAKYRGPPLRLVHNEGSWLVADAGPLGPLGPIIPPAELLRPELKVPIMIYHRFAAELPTDFEQRTLTVDTGSFREQLAWLSDNGYRTITLAELFNAFYYDLPLPAKPIILVIDDGFADAYLEAFPLLQEYSLGATVAMITSAIDQPEYLSWAQIREMAGAGIEFVSHTVNHGDLAATSPEAARSELADSKRTLEEGLGRPVQFLVYPYGQPFASRAGEAQRMILKLLPQEGYVGALTTSSGPPYISTQSANLPYQLHRIPVSGGESLDRFAASIGATP